MEKGSQRDPFCILKNQTCAQAKNQDVICVRIVGGINYVLKDGCDLEKVGRIVSIEQFHGVLVA